MPAPRRFLGEQAQTVETRAAGMRKPLEAWLRRFALAVRSQALRQLRESGPEAIAKAAPPTLEQLQEELRSILDRFGLEQMARATELGAATIGARVSLTDQLILEFLREKEIKVVEIMEATQRASQDAIRSIITEALAEPVRPSTTEIGRRLRNRLSFGSTVDGASAAFTPERAQLIARTEMVQAQNSGITAGYRLSGITRTKWISYRDGRSGRGHGLMFGQERDIGVPFEAPDGTLLMYPGDPNAPIGHTANCRCTTVPVVSPTEASR